MFESIQTLVELTDGLDAIRNVSARLLRHDPDRAADELVTVLEEVSKTFIGFEAVLVRYLSLQFTDGARDRDQAELVALEGGGARVLAGEMRARCSKIEVVYEESLSAWFDSAPITAAERAALHALFLELSDSDSNVIIPAVYQLAEWLEAQVDATATLVQDEKYKAAAEHVVGARREIAPLRRTMGRITGEFRDLEIQFTG